MRHSWPQSSPGHPCLRCIDTAAGALGEGLHAILELELGPLEVFHVENDHFVVENTALTLASIDDHALLVHGRAVVLPWASSKARCLCGVHGSFINVELEQLIGALTDLSLLVEHEAPTEGIDFVLVVD